MVLRSRQSIGITLVVNVAHATRYINIPDAKVNYQIDTTLLETVTNKIILENAVGL